MIYIFLKNKKLLYDLIKDFYYKKIEGKKMSSIYKKDVFKLRIKLLNISKLLFVLFR